MPSSSSYLCIYTTLACVCILFLRGRVWCTSEVQVEGGGNDDIAGGGEGLMWRKYCPIATSGGVDSTQDVDMYTPRCNIPRRHNMSVVDFVRDFQRPGLPVIIVRNPDESRMFQALCNKESILEYAGTHEVVLSTANTFSHTKMRTTLAQYVNTMMDVDQQVGVNGSASYLLFGDNHSGSLGTLFNSYSKLAYPTLRRGDFHLPDDEEGTISWGIAGSGSGVPFHVHGAVFNEVIHGLKRWFLYPPHVKPDFHPDETTLYWLKHVYPTLINRDLMQECVLGPNEVLYIPDMWWHATLNLGQTVNVAVFV